MKVKKNNKKELKKVQEEVKVEEVQEEKVEEVVEEKPVETKKATKEKRIQIKQRTFDVEKKMQFSNWVVAKQFLVLDETDSTYTFGTDAKIKLGVVRKEDCIEV